MKNYRFLNKITTAMIVAALSFSCKSSVSRNAEQAKATEKPKPQQNLIYGDLIIKEQSDYLMIPVSLAEQNEDKGVDLNLSRSYENGRNNQLYNIIFYQKQGSEAHLLLNKKAIITSFDLLEVKAANKPTTRVWLYKIIDQDTNIDKKLNSVDATIGYLSDLSGKNLQQITPNNTRIISWVVVPGQNAIFLKILKDSDNNKKFTKEDKTNFVRVNLDKIGMGTEIISDQIEQEIKSYVFK
ncbi:hypothetical protein CDG76_29545 [Nostoc sp. 'Peltigera membranacea cyanobiont' 210A]|uniref:hypothetical protein n=1 Tax=Nostoc sp. 'Peltigera membranacea cyanobiont' 210A TaxID=2014529 RepID=UPI000B9507FB|nr:hypothetical protein [Nostoc sp. 'Peltigera membranacea cyanobiont' 210A]OYD90867.1 hypothetical protein CDG76_29545 [Nostoc sp. 'Peltigera membranacea cyanobiont' 210A]